MEATEIQFKFDEFILILWISVSRFVVRITKSVVQGQRLNVQVIVCYTAVLTFFIFSS